MKKALFLLMALLIVGSAFAKGESEGVTVSEPPASPAAKAEVDAPAAPKDCESFKQVTARVKCRLDQGNTKKQVPEACRILVENANCIKWYDNVLPCYNQAGAQKDRCFKTVAGFKVSDVASVKGKEELNKYILFLLYDLEQRVENAVAAGTVNSLAASQVIGQIIETKEAVLVARNKGEIVSKVAALKTNYKRVMGL